MVLPLFFAYVYISIHVPSWGTTAVVTALRCGLVISIHVPSWGTTHSKKWEREWERFQSTFPRGERRSPRPCSLSTSKFQSTFPRGERRLLIDVTDSFVYFNPRSLVGNDAALRPGCRLPAYFNPRSLVGNDGKFSQIFFVFLCNKYNFSTFYYPFSLFFSVIHVTFLIFVVRILPAFYVYFWFAPT